MRSRPSFVCALIPSEVVNINATLHGLAGDPRHARTRRSGTAAAPPRRQLRKLRRSADLRAVRSGHSCQRTDAVANGAVGRDRESTIPGVDLQDQPVRNYPYGNDGAHIFGYVGAITEDEYHARSNQGYSPNDVIGKDGLEKPTTAGCAAASAGSRSRSTRPARWCAGSNRSTRFPGNTLVTTIDWRLQRIVDKHLRDDAAQRGNAHRPPARRRGRRHRSRTTAACWRWRRIPSSIPTISRRRSARANSRLPERPAAAAVRSRDRRGLADRLDVQDGHGFGRDQFERRDRPNQVLYDSGYWDCHGVVFRDIAAGGLGRTDFVQRAGGVVGRLFLSARLSPGP